MLIYLGEEVGWADRQSVTGQMTIHNYVRVDILNMVVSQVHTFMAVNTKVSPTFSLGGAED